MHPLRAAGMALLFLPGLVSPAHPDEFSDFRIPSHGLLDWTARIDERGVGSHGSIGNTQAESGFVNGGASTVLYWLRDSDPAFASTSCARATSCSGSSASR